MQQAQQESSLGTCSISAAAIRPRPSRGVVVESQLLPGEIELAVSPWTHLGYASSVKLSATRDLSPPGRGRVYGWVPHNAMENRSSLWESGSPKRRADRN